MTQVRVMRAPSYFDPSRTNRISRPATTRPDPEVVLVTKSGRRWVDKDYKDTDAIRLNFRRLTGRLTLTGRSFKHLRKTSASLLESHRDHGRLSGLFLGHSPRSMREKHYVVPPLVLFDEALAWLQEQFTLITQP